MILRASTTVLGKLQKTLNQFWLVVLTISKILVNGKDYPKIGDEASPKTHLAQFMHNVVSPKFKTLLFENESKTSRNSSHDDLHDVYCCKHRSS